MKEKNSNHSQTKHSTDLSFPSKHYHATGLPAKDEILMMT